MIDMRSEEIADVSKLICLWLADEADKLVTESAVKQNQLIGILWKTIKDSDFVKDKDELLEHDTFFKQKKSD